MAVGGAARDLTTDLVRERCGQANGRVIKFMGDGVLAVFPTASPEEVEDCVIDIQSRGTEVWTGLDEDCRVQAKVGFGAVLVGTLAGQADVVGAVLNALVKTPWEKDVTLDDAFMRLVT